MWLTIFGSLKPCLVTHCIQGGSGMTAIPGTRGMHLGDPTGIERAQELFVRKRYFDATDARRIYKHLVPGSDQPFPFDSGYLDRASRLNHALVFVPQGLSLEVIWRLSGNKVSTGEALLHEHDLMRQSEHPFFSNDYLPHGWWSVGPIIPDSVGVNLLDQTSALDAYVEKVFGENLPEHVAGARLQFGAMESAIEKRIQTDPRGALTGLLDFEINKLFRAPPALLVWLMALCEGINNGERLLSNMLSWTAKHAPAGKDGRSASDSWPVAVGNFGPHGIQTTVFDPWEGRDGLGTCFAYRVTVVKTLNLVA